MGERERGREGVGGGPESIRLRMWSQYEGNSQPELPFLQGALALDEVKGCTSSHQLPRRAPPIIAECDRSLPRVTRAWLAKT